MAEKFIYKIETLSKGVPEYAIRYSGSVVYAKMEGETEFRTDFKTNKTAYEVMLDGKEVSKKEYEKF